jgi:hypothetical protein
VRRLSSARPSATIDAVREAIGVLVPARSVWRIEKRAKARRSVFAFGTAGRGSDA